MIVRVWQGLYPPQSVFGRRRFRRVLLDPPNFEPGSWCGAGKLWIDRGEGEYLLTSRPREGGTRRGYAAEIYTSRNGEDFNLASSITKEELGGICGKKVNSIEGQQLLRDPLTGSYFLYLSVDTAEENVAGAADRVCESRWETYLVSSDDPKGPWKGEDFALTGDADYDSGEARDSTIDVIDGRYYALYKARRAGTEKVHVALALSSDGKRWSKLGELKVDGKPQPDFFLLSGSIFAGCAGPVFVGTKTTDVVKGAALTKRFAAYLVDFRRSNLETVFEAPWIPGSPYEHGEYPIHTYASVAHDPMRDRWLMAVEAVDPTFSKEPGLNLEVDRLLLYVTDPS
ncbi:MAG: hypothetical protein JTT11_08160 [Candidatus Brockarchaeota archaeon]|nr:hypothetical protein [Candidatus Brockarchaeota archaeon]